jgi:GBP family porin
MKVSQLTLAVAAAAVALPAMAAPEVEIFGFLDQGFTYLDESLSVGMGGPNSATQQVLDANGKLAKGEHKSNLSLGTGNVSTLGFRATEQINDDWSVQAHLEAGYLLDTGEFYNSSYMFERESTLNIISKTYGQLKMGRMPAMVTGSGTTGLFNSRVNPFGAGWGNMTGGWKFTGTLAAARHNNAIYYTSPDFNGWKFYAQHALGDTKGENLEGSSDVNRYSAIGFTKTGDRYFIAGAVDWLKMGSPDDGSKPTLSKDSYKALIGGNYKFDHFTLYGTFQWMENIQYIGGYSTKQYAPKTSEGQVSSGFDAWSVATGINYPVGPGTIKFSVGYAQGENQNTDTLNDFERMNVGLGYVHNLSKRTSLYGITGFFWQDADWQDEHIRANEVIVGMMHRF